MTQYHIEWHPTVLIRWKRTGYGDAVLQQLYYSYEVDGEGMFGAKTDEGWRDVEVVNEKVS